jgi:hypothetical protein
VSAERRERLLVREGSYQPWSTRPVTLRADHSYDVRVSLAPLAPLAQRNVQDPAANDAEGGATQWRESEGCTAE